MLLKKIILGNRIIIVSKYFWCTKTCTPLPQMCPWSSNLAPLIQHSILYIHHPHFLFIYSNGIGALLTFISTSHELQTFHQYSMLFPVNFFILLFLLDLMLKYVFQYIKIIMKYSHTVDFLSLYHRWVLSFCTYSTNSLFHSFCFLPSNSIQVAAFCITLFLLWQHSILLHAL